MKSILITGCSTGIGLQTALLLQKENYNVFATARKEEDVQKLSKLGLQSYLLDVTKYDTIDDTFDKILKKTNGKLDILFNNAGYGQAGAIEDIKIEDLKVQFETNVFGLHYITTKAIKIMRNQGYGKIIQHSSILGLVSLKYRGAYNASKYAIEGLSDTLRLELLDEPNIFVTLLNTGPIISEFRNNALKTFKNIDIQNSHFKNIYEKDLISRKNGTKKNIPFTLYPIDVAKIVLKIIKTKKPKPRYYITKATTILIYCKRVLSTNLLDKILNKI